jgi:hypothetical protein
MTDRERFLKKVDTEWDRLTAAVRSVPRRRLTEKGVSGDWSVKDIAGHVATWDRLIHLTIEGDVEARRTVTSQGVDAYNESEARRKAKLPAAEAISDLESTHGALRAALHSAAAEVFAADYPYRRALADDTHLHYAEHAADIERWVGAAPKRSSA